MMAILLIAACSDKDSGDSTQDSLREVEDGLLDLINQERIAGGLPPLQRDAGLDAIMAWFAEDVSTRHVLDHTDSNGRAAEERVWYYGDDASVRCSEILNWWGGDASAQVHYEAFRNSPAHHDAYMEVGMMDLGGAGYSGVFVVDGTGPADSEFEGREGSYAGVVICDQPVDLVIDPQTDQPIDQLDPAPDAGPDAPVETGPDADTGTDPTVDPTADPGVDPTADPTADPDSGIALDTGTWIPLVEEITTGTSPEGIGIITYPWAGGEAGAPRILVSRTNGLDILDLTDASEVFPNRVCNGTCYGGLAVTTGLADGDTIVTFGSGGTASSAYIDITGDFGMTALGSFSNTTDGVAEPTDPAVAPESYLLVDYSAGAVFWYAVDEEFGLFAPIARVNSLNFPVDAGQGPPISAAGGWGDSDALVVTGNGMLWAGPPDRTLTSDTGEDAPVVFTNEGSVGLDPRRIRCLYGDTTWCAVSAFGSDEVYIVERTSDGVEITDDEAVGDGPVGIDVATREAGGLFVASTGYNDDSAHLTTVGGDGLVTGTTTIAIPECDGPGHIVFLPRDCWPDAATPSVAVSCNLSSRVLVAP